MNHNYVHDEDSLECDRRPDWSKFRPAILISVLFWLIVFACSLADAEIGLAHACTTSACTQRSWQRPTPDTLVRSCLASEASCTFGSQVARRFGDLAPADKVDTCAADIAPGPFAPPNRPSVDPACGDPCGCGGPLDRKTVVAKSAVQITDVEDPSTFVASVLAGVAPLTTVLSWDVQGVSACTASGSWTGAKAAKGTQTITGLMASAKYTLTCTSAVTHGQATLSWVAPTQNTDGSVLTDLAGFRIVYGTSPTALSSVIQIPVKTATSYQVEQLTPGATYSFAVRAYNSAGTESANSAVGSKSIAGTPSKTWTKTVDVVVTSPPIIPNPPTGLTVTEPTAYRYDQTKVDTPRLFAIGTVPLGTVCDPKHQVLGLYRIPKAAVTLVPGASVNIALAKCG